MRPVVLYHLDFSIMMSYTGDAYRFFASLRMTCLRVVVILNEAKDLYESNTGNTTFLLLP